MVESLQAPPLAEKPDYTAYCDYLESRGWTREQITLDELNTNLVTLFGLAAGGTGTVIDIRAPAGQKISIMGTQQIPRGADARSAHALRIRLADTADAEVPIFSKIRIWWNISYDWNCCKSLGTNCSYWNCFVWRISRNCCYRG